MIRALLPLFLISAPALAGELWVEVDVTEGAAGDRVHIEVPYELMDALNIEELDGDIDAQVMRSAAESMKEGDRQKVLEATEDGSTVIVNLHNRANAKGKAATDFFVEVNEPGGKQRKTVEIPLSFLAMFGGAAGALDSGGVDLSKVVGGLGDRPAFTLLAATTGAGEQTLIGTR